MMRFVQWGLRSLICLSILFLFVLKTSAGWGENVCNTYSDARFKVHVGFQEVLMMQ